jgi:hypothetical protein
MLTIFLFLVVGVIVYFMIGVAMATFDNWLQGRFDESGSYLPDFKVLENKMAMVGWPILLLIIVVLLPAAFFDRLLALRKSEKGKMNFSPYLKSKPEKQVSYDMEHFNAFIEKRMR